MNLKIKDLPEFGRYLVASVSSPESPYMVDLTSRIIDGRAYGYCSCMHFATTCKPNLERHGKWIPYRKDGDHIRKGVTECKHISAARNHFMLNITMPMLAKLQNGIESR